MNYSFMMAPIGVLLFAALPPQLSGAAFTFSALTACPGCSTGAIGINDLGVVSGGYFDDQGVGHSFLKSGGVYTLFDPNAPDVVFSEGGHINNAGQIAGDYVASDGLDRPYVRNADGRFSLKPGFSDAASVTFGTGITSAGLVVGSYTLDPNGQTGFVGYILNGNTFTSTFQCPGASSTYALDNNDAGSIAGSYKTNVAGEDTAGIQHGFIRNGDTFTTIDYVDPDHDSNTYAWDINNKGQIVGYSFPGDPAAGPFSGFQASPIPEPVTWALGLVGVCFVLVSRGMRPGSI